MIHDTQSAQISQKQDGRNMYVQSWKQCALPVITTMALWQLMHLGTWCRWCTSCPQVLELPQSHSGQNQEGTLFSWLNRYIYIYNAETLCKIWFFPIVPWLPSSMSNHDGKWVLYDYHIYIYIYIYSIWYKTYPFFSSVKPCNTKNGQNTQYSASQTHGPRWIPSPFYILLQAVQSNSRLY